MKRRDNAAKLGSAVKVALPSRLPEPLRNGGCAEREQSANSSCLFKHSTDRPIAMATDASLDISTGRAYQFPTIRHPFWYAMDRPLAVTIDTAVTDAILNLIAHLPTRSIKAVAEEAFFAKLSDADFMRLAVLLAQKSYEEGGCPIGAVVIDTDSRQIVGKGHNTLVQEGHPYNHGETSAIRDAGRQDFSRTTLFTSLSPCDVCATLLYMRQFGRVVVGDVTNASGNEDLLRSKGIEVTILEDAQGVALYRRYREEHPALDLEDWKGLAAIRGQASGTR